jgi:hypothetical protein
VVGVPVLAAAQVDLELVEHLVGALELAGVLGGRPALGKALDGAAERDDAATVRRSVTTPRLASTAISAASGIRGSRLRLARTASVRRMSVIVFLCSCFGWAYPIVSVTGGRVRGHHVVCGLRPRVAIDHANRVTTAHPVGGGPITQNA